MRPLRLPLIDALDLRPNMVFASRRVSIEVRWVDWIDVSVSVKKARGLRAWGSRRAVALAKWLNAHIGIVCRQCGKANAWERDPTRDTAYCGVCGHYVTGLEWARALGHPLRTYLRGL